MLKKIMPCFGLKTCLMTLILFTGSAHSIMLDTIVSSPVITVGDSFNVDFVISDLGNGSAPSVGAYNVIFDYNAGSVAATGVTFGVLLDDPIFSSIQDAIFNPTSVDVTETSFLFDLELDALQSDSFTLFSLSFDAINAGNANFGISFLEVTDADSVANILTVTTSIEAVTVLASTVPEPHVMLLIMMGLISTTCLKRNRQATLS